MSPLGRVVCVTCLYESVALVCGWPCVTDVARRSLLFRAAVLGWLFFHFRQIREAVTP